MKGGKARELWLIPLLAVYFLLAYYLLNRLGTTCIFLKCFGIPCPGCGMTRALISLLKLDFRQAFRHNVVVFFMPYVAAYVLFDFKHKVHLVLLKCVAAIAIINWLIKIFI